MNDRFTTPGETILVPVTDLYLHKMNPRQNGDDADTEAMAQSIAVNGLLQNLAGYADPDRPGIGIVAGGRRLRALQRLAAEGSGLMDSREPDFDAIPVQVTADPMLARSWAGTEAATQKPLHPVDEIRAYAAMADQGSDAQMIARAFAQTERHVRGRLALAHLQPETLTALRGGEISLDAAKALTLARTAAAELAMLDTIAGRNHSASWIRRELTEQKVPATDFRVRFIGIDAYTAAGGELDEDLFEGNSYLHDGSLVQRLFDDRLQAEAERLRAEQGWSWTKTSADYWVSHVLTDGLTPIRKTPGEITEADSEEFDRLAELEEGGVLDEDGQSRLDELQARLDGDWTDEDRAHGGIIVHADRDGKLTIHGAYAEKSTKRAPAEDDAAPAARKPDLTQAGAEDLRRITLLALQSAMARKTELVLDLFAWQLDRAQPAYGSPFEFSIKDQNIAPEAETALHYDDALDSGSNGYQPPDFDEDTLAAFTAFRDQGKKHRNAVITRHLVRALQLPEGRMLPIGRWLVEETGADIRACWTPDANSYFSRLSVTAMQALWAEMLDLAEGDDRLSEFAALKKKEKVAELHRLFNDPAYRSVLQLTQEQTDRIAQWLPQGMTAPAEDAS